LDILQNQNVVFTIKAPAARAFHGLDLMHFGFPKAQNVGREVQFFSNLGDGVIHLALRHEERALFVFFLSDR